MVSTRPRHSALKRSYSAPAAKPLAAYSPASLSLALGRSPGSQTPLHTPAHEHPTSDAFALGGFFPSHSAGAERNINNGSAEQGWDWLRADSSIPPLPALSASTLTASTSSASSAADDALMNMSRPTRRVRFEMDLLHHRQPSPPLLHAGTSHATSPSSSIPTTPELVYAPLTAEEDLLDADDVLRAEDKLGLVSLSENLPKLFTSTLMIPRSSSPVLLSPQIIDEAADTDALHTAFCARRRAHSMPPAPPALSSLKKREEPPPLSPGGLFLPSQQEDLPQVGWTGYLVEQVKRWLI